MKCLHCEFELIKRPLWDIADCIACGRVWSMNEYYSKPFLGLKRQEEYFGLYEPEGSLRFIEERNDPNKQRSC